MCLFQTSSTKLQKTIMIFQLISVILLLSVLLACTPPDAPSDTPAPPVTPAPKFTLSSSASDGGFNPGGTIPLEFGYRTNASAIEGTGSFPKLSWSNVPANTRYFLLIVQNDMNKSQSCGIFMLDANARSLPKAVGTAIPSGNVDSATAASHAGKQMIGVLSLDLERYLPPIHSGMENVPYTFKLYALDITKVKGSISGETALLTDLKAQFASKAVNNFLDSLGDQAQKDYIADGSTDRIKDLEVYLNGLGVGVILASASITGTYTGK